MTIYHSCLAKIKVIWERTGVLVGHDEIDVLCAQWGCASPEEFYEHMNGMTDDELKSDVDKAKEEVRKKKKKILEAYLAQERKQYA